MRILTIASREPVAIPLRKRRRDGIVEWLGPLFFLVLSMTSARAATYYVSGSGSDSNPGTSLAPWRNCPGMPGYAGSTSLAPGDIVYFKSTDTWTSASASSVLDVTGGVTYDGGSWGGGSRAVLRATGALGQAVVTFLHDHSATPTIVKGFDVDVNAQSTHGVIFDGGYAALNLTGAMKTIQDCIIHNVGAGYFYGVFVSAWNNRTVSNVSVLNCVVHTTPRSAINDYPGPQDGSQTSNVMIRGCEAYGAGTDPTSGGFGINIKGLSNSSIVEYNYSHDNHGGGLFLGGDSRTPARNGPLGAVVRYNIIRSNGNAGIYVQYGGNKSADVYANLILDNTNAGIFLDPSVTNDISFKIYNNTFLHNGTPVSIGSTTATFSVFDLENNIFYASNGSYCVTDANGGSITSHNNNLYFRADNGALVRSGGATFTPAQISSWEGTARVGNPDFKSETNLPAGFAASVPDHDGLNLTAGSPAVDSGATLLAAYRTSINAVSRPAGTKWDIGAYELASQTVPSAPQNLRVVVP